MSRIAAGLSAIVLGLAGISPAWSQSSAPTKPATSKTAPKPAGRLAAASSPWPAVAADAGYRFAAQPDWVRELPAPRNEATRATQAGAKARRDLLVDLQIQLAGKQPVTFVRLHKQALDSSTLREVSEPQISFNPVYQRLVIHALSVLREGQRSDRLKTLRVEMMRREQQLERQMLDGQRTALLMLNDVRVGDVVELAYSIEGENPIFEGRFASLIQLAGDAPIDRLHLRLEAPTTRKLQTRGIASDLPVERFEERGRQVLRLQREQVAGVVEEQGTPPWFKVYPALHISEYQSWDEVDQWAQRLFAQEAPSGEIAQRIADWKAKGLAREALLAEVLRFVQDEVRYFSLSLGESSHRPKPAARTLAERLGDCKDKVLLLNTLLTGLGFEARPALVSMFRNRGVSQYLPGHDQFDHVITRVDLEGRAFYLDPTMNGQGLGLRQRGYYPYGQALVVGAGQGLQAVQLPDFAQDSLSYTQDWDLSDLRQNARLDTRMVARGLSAERWRASFAAVGTERIAETLSGAYVRMLPGLKPGAAPELLDDRERNELELRLHFEHPGPGRYQRGALELEVSAVEIADMLAVPPEARRRTPYLLDQPRLVEQRLNLKAPRPFSAAAPAPQQVSDRHFLFSSRTEVAGPQVGFISRLERRSDEVLPAEMDGFRERVQRARQLVGNRLRLSLLDSKSLPSLFSEVDRRLVKYRGARPDELLRILQQQEFVRLSSAQLMAQLKPGGPLALRVLAERGQANNLLGDFQAGLADAEAALAIDPQDGEALEARGVALVGLGRVSEALADFQRLGQLGTRSGPGTWLGVSQFQLGQFAEAERSLREQLTLSSGEERQFALLWLYLAVERQRAGQGQAAIAADLAQADAQDAQAWPGALLRYLGGRLTRDELLKLARDKPELERLRLAEAYFFIGQQLAAQGQSVEARSWYERTLATQAVPYREFTLAQLELQRRAQP